MANESTVTTGGNKSKAQELVEAARRRNQIEQEVAEGNEDQAPNGVPEDEKTREAMKEAAEEKAAVKPQAVAGSLDGIDVEAMGDVKGDGGDAKNYEDGDPDKALGVPNYVHGLDESKATGESVTDAAAHGTRISKRTDAEMQRGREALNQRYESNAQARRSRVTVTDADDDPKGDKGKKAAEAAAKSKAKK